MLLLDSALNSGLAKQQAPRKPYSVASHVEHQDPKEPTPAEVRCSTTQCSICLNLEAAARSCVNVQGDHDVKKLIAPAIIVGVVAAVIAIVVFGGNAPPPIDPMTGQSDFNIPPQDSELVAEGEVLYQVSCAACHGSDLRGTDLGPSQLSVVYQPGHHSDLNYLSAVFNGVQAHHWNFGDMAPISGLTEDDVVRIIAYIREAQRTEGFEPYPPR